VYNAGQWDTRIQRVEGSKIRCKLASTLFMDGVDIVEMAEALRVMVKTTDDLPQVLGSRRLLLM